MRLPDELVIGGRRYTLSTDPDELAHSSVEARTGLLGQCDRRTQRILVDLASAVLVFRIMAPVLVFHASGPWRGRIELEDRWLRTEFRTRCGIVHYAHEWRDDPAGDWRKTEHRAETHRGTYLRRDHAEKIGRPCSRCFS